MKKLFFSVCLLPGFWASSQSVSKNLQTAFSVFEADSQLKHALTSLYIIDAKSGAVVFDKNSQIGLAPASTQKIITSATAFELLGKDYRFKTQISYDGKIEKDILKGNLYLMGSSDPSIGSWRYESTKEARVLNEMKESIKRLNIKSIDGADFFIVNNFEKSIVPDGWIWQDIGNYYGAGAGSFNWRENQYDLILKSGIIRGTPVEVTATRPALYGYTFQSDVKAAAKGTGDNAYIYLPVGSNNVYVKGTIPVGEDAFVISGAMPSPAYQFTSTLFDSLNKSGIKNKLKLQEYKPRDDTKYYLLQGLSPIYTYYSPTLDSIIYWFNKRSINLYGEALVKTFSFEKTGFGSTDSGLVILKRFWKEKGLGEDELNMHDGSGLSPLNRVTTHAQVEILKFAKTRDWYSYFYNALPEFNNMKMKSGTISDTKGFCGYHTSRDGNEYIFSFLVNN